MRRVILILLSWILVNSHGLAQSELPRGSYPPAIDFKHFPNRAFAVVWRNWNLIEPERIAKTIGCRGKDVVAMARAMGLPRAQKIPADYEKNMYITVLRRNWHLLPYEQLLTLLNMSVEELNSALKNDDFLFVKLGNLKPNCAPVKYEVPGAKELLRAKEMRELVHRYFNGLQKGAELPFSFIEDLKTPAKNYSIKMDEGAKGLRFIYSYFGVFGDPLIDNSVDPYPEGLLAKLAERGVSGVWMHVVLDQMAPGGPKFPEFGEGHHERIANLRKIVQRAKKYGIDVYLYMNEPRAMPSDFFRTRPEMEGVGEGDLRAMCTSNKDVNEWIHNSLAYIFKQLPGLGGVFTITGSENLTSCASHGQQQNCPRCSKREYADIIASVNKTIADGVHEGNPAAKVIVWDWGWSHVAAEIIPKLPKSVWFMSVSEWATPFQRGGVNASVGEYSISVSGPGDRAKTNWRIAKNSGLKTVAKVQFNNSWELSAVPWIPVTDLVASHASALAKQDVDGVLLSWSLGGYPSVNLEVAEAFSKEPYAEIDTVLNRLAHKYYDAQSVPLVRKAWTAFSEAFREFPFSAEVIYKAPLQVGPANLLFSQPSNYSATMVGLPYDDLNSWAGNYPRHVFISQLDKLVDRWKSGISLYKEAVELSSHARKAATIKDFRIAEAALLHFSSVANQAKFVDCRDRLRRTDISESLKDSLKGQIFHLLQEEIRIARKLYQLAGADSRIGFEASNQYYYTSQDLIEKVINCDFVEQEIKSEQN
ncbi:hypothetical protein [Arcticibacter sp.]|jgi:hypothetical protein|uniref:hypothetical protein n=1 Tax=Arcticibacter sp. TaxID=1872630 RepID=UPI00388F30EB